MDRVDDTDEFDRSGIAQYLSDLSQDGQLPQGTGPKIDIAPFLADDVSFEDNDWLRRTLAVQQWLGLDQSVAENSPPSDSGISVMRLISPDPAEACVRIEEDLVTLTDLGAQHLDTWLSRAVAHREAFLEALEEGRGIGEASDEWFLLWEESSALARQPALIKASVRALTIKNFVDYARDRSLDLNPSYQRDSVWSIGDSQLLIDSILRGIPVPSIILTQVEGADELQIVDGKQRLTAILRFVGQHPAARDYAKSLNAEREFDDDHKKFMRKHHLNTRDVSDNYLPFRLRHYPPGDPLHSLSRRLYCEIKDQKIQSGQGHVTVKSIFEGSLTPYLIPVIVYENTRLQDIHHVFSVYNKQGRKLNAEELRNATFHHLGLTKLLLVLSGDRPSPDELAPYLPSDVKDGIEEVGETLKDRGFGTMRFKRTKVLSWVCALMLHSPNSSSDSSYVTPSTASHIDSLLRAISDGKGNHTLFQNTALVSLARDVKAAVALHAEVEDAWSPRFRSKKGQSSRWEELPLVASLLATLVLVAVGEGGRLKPKLEQIRALAESSPGPNKTQNKTQWKYIATFAVEVLRVVDLDLDASDEALVKRYGYSCIAVLQSLSDAPES